MYNFKKGYVLAASLGSFIWGFWIEDMTYFSWIYPKDFLKPESWVNWTLGGLFIGKYWVPTVYFIMSGVGFLLFAIAFIRGRKDVITALMARTHAGISFKSSNRFHWLIVYLASILPFIFVIWIVCIVAASITSMGFLTTNLLRIVTMSIIVYISTLISLAGSNKIYERLTYLMP